MSALHFKELSETEVHWIESQIAVGRAFVTQHASSYQDLSLEALDAAWAAWLAAAPGEAKGNANEVNRAINAVGIPFGCHLTDTGEFEWCIATDEWGTDLAVRALPGRGDILIYPADFVSKRWEKKTAGFLVDSFQKIMEQVSGIRKEWDVADGWVTTLP